MADTSHLEKMGRELKCPICLSLLDSSISLTCNHVFCNSCIHKSMKSGSNCPVCKVPYQRREIRPAPHMDNLVNIYKSMEVASGLTLFVTQNQSSAKAVDAERQTEGDSGSDRKETNGESPLTNCQRKKGVCSKKSKPKPKYSGRNRGKSSFSMNKRVQVPQSPITETPVRPAKTGDGENQLTNNVMSKRSVSPSEHPLSNGKHSPRISPFFWLREDDVERPSQQTDVDRLTCTPTKAPSFSDIKDSDDDVPSNYSPKELGRNSGNVELFDSELFEWTQRPCSPELCSSPIVMQVGEAAEYDRMPGKEWEAPSNDASTDREVTIKKLENVSFQENNSIRDNELQTNSCPGRKSDGCQIGCDLSRKRSRKASKKSQNKRQQKNMDIVGEAYDCQETANDFVQGQGCDSQFDISGLEPHGTLKTRSDGSPDSNLLDNVEPQTVLELPASPGSEKGINKEKKLKNAKRNFKSINKGHGVDPAKRKKQKQNLAKKDSIEVTFSQGGRCGDTVSKSNLSNEISVGRPYSVPERSISRKNKKHCQQITSRTEEKVHVINLQEKMADGSKAVHIEAEDKAEANNVHIASNNGNLRRSLKLGDVHLQTDMPTLRKCNANSIECAFCHSTEETKASGEMVHYSKGKPVSATYSGGFIIHSHKNCTEWAPNVYFEDDIAVNLEEELARSRRIKCSLCGVKGAALGCYERSCRKSFHVPCAKMLCECRWDREHFVILCPLHASSKLPCELSLSQVSQVKKGKCNLNGNFLQQRPQASCGRDTNTNGWIHSCPSEKVIICCSGLATDEKEIVSEFVQSSGVAVLKTWNPSVTHVVASTNENGACKRTIKVLKGILEGKWILSIKWVQACMKAMKLVEETPYEISCDIHGVKNGPRLGRLRLLNKQPKLFSGFKFYLMGSFSPTYKGYLQDLVTAAGGSILHRKPIAENQEISASRSLASTTVVVYNIELPDKCDLVKEEMFLDRRRSDAEALASSSGARVANNNWVLNCIAGHKLQDL